MVEWWTYAAEDFVPYSARSYWRLIERHNGAIWPTQVVAIAGGLACLWQVMWPRPIVIRALMVGFAIAWAWIAWAFLLSTYQDLNWAAPYLAAGYFVQAGMLAVVALLAPTPIRSPIGLQRSAGACVLAYAVLFHPLLPLITDRALATSEVVAVVPDPTALATIGFLLSTLHTRTALVLCLLPAMSCVLSAMTQSVLAQTEALLLITGLLVAFFGVAAAWIEGGGRREF